MTTPSTGWLAAVLGAIGVALGSILTFFSGNRNTSGSVETSNASEVWTASDNLMDDMTTEIAALRAEAAIYRQELADSRAELAASRREMAEELARHRLEMAAANKERDEYREEVYKLRRDIHHLQAILENTERSKSDDGT